MEIKDEFLDLVDYVESFLLDYYRFDPVLKARECVVLAEDCKRAHVEVHLSSENSFEVGLLFSKEWIESGLFRHSLDILSCVVEEVSHFHTLLCCIEKGHQVSRMDLEAQAEVDKVIFLIDSQRRNGVFVDRAHVQSTTRSVISEASIIAIENEQEVYRRASLRAAKIIADALLKMSHVAHPTLEDLRPYLSDRHPGLRRAA